MKNLMTIASLVAVGLAVPAWSQDGPPPPDAQGDAPITRAQEQMNAEARFAALDGNHDGALSAEELAAAAPGGGLPGGPGMRGRHGPGGPGGFGRIDTDGDGKVSKAEFVTSLLRRFDMQDENKDGTVTSEEREAARARMMQRMQNGGGFGGGWGGPPPGDE